MTKSLRVLLIHPHDSYRAAVCERLLERLPNVEIDSVGPGESALPVAAGADAIFTFGAFMTDALLRQATRLRWIQCLGSGVDGIVDQPSLRNEVVITNARGLHAVPVAEATLSLMLALARRLPEMVRNQAEHRWTTWRSSLLEGASVGILGVGAIAEALALRCKAFNMRVVGISGRAERAPGFDQMRSKADLTAAVGDLDYLVLLTPLSAETRGIVNARVLAAMKPESCLVNVARGGVVDEPALISALTERRIRAAACDVFAQEPLPASHALWSTPHLLISPHLAGMSDTEVDRLMPLLINNAEAVLSGELSTLINRVR